MEQIIDGTSGKIKMLYNYMTQDRKLYKTNDILSYNKIVKVDEIRECRCAGKVNTYYIVNISSGRLCSTIVIGIVVSGNA
jgi:hypothetical protein